MNFQFPIHYGAFTPCPRDRRPHHRRPRRRHRRLRRPDPNCPPGMENGFEKDFAVVWPAPGIGDMQGGIPPHAHAGAEPESLHRDDRARRSSAATAAGRSEGQSAVHRAGRTPDPPRGDRQHRRADAAAQRLSERGVHHQRRSAVPAGEHQQRAGRHASTSPTCITASSRSCSGRARAATCARRSSSISSTRSPRTAASGGCATTAVPAVPATATNIGQPAIPAITPDFAPPRMYSETPAQLVAHLTHPNGWWRDMAQRLLILKQDKSVVPALQQMVAVVGQPASRASTRCGRSRASARSTPALVREAMKDTEPAHAHPGDSRERDALQGRRQVASRTTTAR